ncbi:MGMT family protein [candidate division KSB1 bacterium]|nr:MGMT family protein [candidate division KSB1 bacterium]
MKPDIKKTHPNYQRIYKVIGQIPYGSVATYGQIARLAGLPGQARMVGYALHSSPDRLELPWHRVINSQGTISFPKAEVAYDVQRSLLEAEGIIFKNDRVNLRRYQWNPEDIDWNFL